MIESVIRSGLMSVSNSLLRGSAFLLCLVSWGTILCPAQTSPSGPTTWWPDPATGLMWAGQSTSPHPGAMTWEQASSYCASLSLGGFTDWRMPTLDETRGDEYLYPVDLARR